MKSPVERNPGYIRTVGAIIWKDLSAEFHSRELISAMLVFALLILLVFNFAFDLDIQTRQSAVAGVLWVTFIFTGTIGLNRSMAGEKDRGCLDGLLLAPVDRSAIYFGKMIGTLIFMLIVEIIVIPVFSVLYNFNLMDLRLGWVIFLGSLGFSTVGTLLSTMAVQTRTREILLPILLFPVIIPVLTAAVKATLGIFQGMAVADLTVWINMLGAYDVIFLAVGWLAFDFIVQEG